MTSLLIRTSVICLALLLPLQGLALGQDVVDLKEAARELKAAVKSGEMTAEEAKARWVEILKEAGAGKDWGDKKKDDGEKKGGDKKAGGGKKKDDGEKAAKKAEKRAARDAKKAERKQKKLDILAAKLKAAVADGKMSEEKAAKKWEKALSKVKSGKKAGKKGKAKKDDPERDGLKALGKKLKEAVENGDLTEEEAQAKWNAYLSKAYLAKVGKQLKAAVKAGKMTEEEAKEKWEVVLDAIAEKKAEAEKD